LTQPWREDAEALSPGEALIQRVPDPSPSGPPPGYDYRSRNIRGGTVTAVTDTEVHVHNTDEDFVVLLTPDTVRDEGLWLSHLPIEVGDRVLARGAMRGQAFAADSIWINARNWYGPILEVLSPEPPEIARVRLRDRYDLSPYHEQEPDGHIVGIHPQTILSGPVQPPGGNAAGYSVLEGPAGERGFAPAAGQFLHVTGREYRGTLWTVRAMQ
jgi:hypothetical protein